ncbi:MAG TPA: formylglycine-generating enzyme family protein, partial [Pyrinomonadaceae bacterium]|nr:formylglycine-generating enzyme family protein [Pyrinomonadaceae bacterium]
WIGNLNWVERGAIIIALAGLAISAIVIGLKVDDSLQTPISENSSPVTNQSERKQQLIEPSPEPNPKKSVTNRIGIELVRIPPGSFMMGSENSFSNERPAHQVTIREGFYMGKYEVTQAQWRQVMGTNPSKVKGDNLPVESVSWNDTQEFIGKLNELNDGFVYRLPSEAEWEYACRAVTTGDSAGNLNSMARHKEKPVEGTHVQSKNQSALPPRTKVVRKMPSKPPRYTKNHRRGSHPVGQEQANAFGLYDMHGNVWEWCADAWHENYMGAPTDGSTWLSGDSIYRVIRGGAWDSDAYHYRSAFRGRKVTGTSAATLGFRVAASARK